MVLAAGLGQRLRPLTDSRPKPLIEVAGRAILDHVLDALAAAGVKACVVNTHYLGAMIDQHLAGRVLPRVEISAEEDLLDTGGGVVKARPRLGAGPFLIANGDILWHDGPSAPALARLAAAFDPQRMDGLLLVAPVEGAVGYDGSGDFFLGPDGCLSRRGDAPSAPFVFTGVQILNPALLDAAPDGAFSLNLLYDRAIAAGRLYGLAHDGAWFHIGTPAGRDLAEAAIAAGDGAP
jgi:MurNAc alpha-1-phosphate uridylyltransferase